MSENSNKSSEYKQKHIYDATMSDDILRSSVDAKDDISYDPNESDDMEIQGTRAYLHILLAKMSMQRSISLFVEN